MAGAFLEELDINEPHYHLNAGSGTHAEQTARIMVAFEGVCLKEKPDVVVVVGDVNSTLACSITAKKLGIRVAHVEAGLRSGDLTMPEEINRIVTDAVSDLLFASEKSAVENLRREGKRDDQIFFVGNIMIDTLYYGLKKIAHTRANGGSKSETNRYCIATLHRPSNVDEKERLEGIISALAEISKDMPVYFPVHPRTISNLERFGLKGILEHSNIILMAPLSYLQFLQFLKDAALVLTDSGGVQEEATVLGTPCFTLRENTERPITVEEGTNTIVGTTPERILEEYRKFRAGIVKKGRIPELWDGRCAERIVDILITKFSEL